MLDFELISNEVEIEHCFDSGIKVVHELKNKTKQTQSRERGNFIMILLL